MRHLVVFLVSAGVLAPAIAGRADTTPAAPEPSLAPAPRAAAATAGVAAPIGKVYAGAGGDLAGELGLRAGLNLEVGVRQGASDIWLRGKLGLGGYIDRKLEGTYQEAVAGVEGQRCWSGGALCLFIGIDAGVLRTNGDARSHYEGSIEPVEMFGPTAMPRFGIDTGGTVRLRLTLQARAALLDEVRTGSGIGLSVFGRFPSRRTASVASSPRASSLPPPVATTEPSATPPPAPPSLASPAVAVPARRAYVALGAEAAVDLMLRAGATLELGIRPWSSNLWLRGKGGAGSATNFAAGGGYAEAAVGIEAQSCRQNGAVCFFAGIDGGVVRLSTDEDEDSTTKVTQVGPSVMPRIGIDTGGKVRIRFTLQPRIAWLDRTYGGLGLGLGLLL